LKRKNAFKTFLLLVLAFLCAGCAADPVVIDLTGYINQGILDIAELETTALQRYATVVGPNYTTDERVYETLRDWTVPLYGRYLEGLRRIRPETEEIKGLHKTYLQGAELLYEGFREKMFGIQEKDDLVIVSANHKIERGGALVGEWRKGVAGLRKEHGLEQEGRKGIFRFLQP
jgi:hypothetical protein